MEHVRQRARGLQRRWGAAYPVGVGGVGARAHVQRVVATSGNGAAGLVVQSALGSAAGAFLALWRQGATLGLAFPRGRTARP